MNNNFFYEFFFLGGRGAVLMGRLKSGGASDQSFVVNIALGIH